MSPVPSDAWIEEHSAAYWRERYEDLRAQYSLLAGGLDEATGIADEPTPKRLTDFLLARIAEDAQGSVTLTHRPTAARVLADCEARRRIVEQVDAWQRSLGGQQTKDALEVVARRLAKVYADHPEYRAEWRP